MFKMHHLSCLTLALAVSPVLAFPPRDRGFAHVVGEVRGGTGMAADYGSYGDYGNYGSYGSYDALDDTSAAESASGLTSTTSGMLVGTAANFTFAPTGFVSAATVTVANLTVTANVTIAEATTTTTTETVTVVNMTFTAFPLFNSTGTGVTLPAGTGSVGNHTNTTVPLTTVTVNPKTVSFGNTTSSTTVTERPAKTIMVRLARSD